MASKAFIPRAYISIPAKTNSVIKDAYIDFVSNLGFDVKIWKGGKYDRSIMNDADIHFIVHDYNTKNTEYRSGHIPKGCYEESVYAKQKLKIDSYLLYIPIHNMNGIGIFNYDTIMTATSDYDNWSEVYFKGRESISNLLIRSFPSEQLIPFDDLKFRVAVGMCMHNAYARFLNAMKKAKPERLRDFMHYNFEEIGEEWIEAAFTPTQIKRDFTLIMKLFLFLYNEGRSFFVMLQTGNALKNYLKQESDKSFYRQYPLTEEEAFKSGGTIESSGKTMFIQRAYKTDLSRKIKNLRNPTGKLHISSSFFQNVKRLAEKTSKILK